jgi:hypothetical protein
MVHGGFIAVKAQGIPFLEDIYWRAPEKSIDLGRRTVYFP